jgi:CubicO group peptidase (beta-lactamase class C family)
VKLILSILFAAAAVSAQSYYPDLHDWQRRTPAQAGINEQKLEQAIAFARASESKAPRDLEKAHYLGNAREPYGNAVGPFKPRGDVTGVVVRGGYLVAEWGEPHRVDMTYSVTKSFVSSTVGVAYDRGLIRDLNEPVRKYVPTEHFESDHNAKITWDHLLRQTSDWEGTLWGKPDWADRPPSNQPLQEYAKRKHNEPGTSYKYNDTRVNLLAFAALQVWRRPLPQVLKEFIMDPIGASNTWRWHGYENSWVRSRWRQGTVGERRRSFRRRHVDHGSRSGEVRANDAAEGSMEGSPASIREVGEHGTDSNACTARLRLHELVSQHRQEAVSRGVGEGVRPSRRGREHDLRRPGPRSGSGGALDRWVRTVGVRPPDAGRVSELTPTLRSLIADRVAPAVDRAERSSRP